MFIRLFVTCLLMQASAAVALEATAGDSSVSANQHGLNAKIDSINAAMTAVVNKIIVCNNKGMMFVSDTTKPGRDADGCVAVTSSASELKYVRTVTYTPTSSTPSALSYGPSVSHDLCVMSDEGAQTTDDNHGHRCLVQATAGTGSNTYRMGGYARRMTVQCAMQCYDY